MFTAISRLIDIFISCSMHFCCNKLLKEICRKALLSQNPFHHTNALENMFSEDFHPRKESCNGVCYFQSLFFVEIMFEAFSVYLWITVDTK